MSFLYRVINVDGHVIKRGEEDTLDGIRKIMANIIREGIQTSLNDNEVMWTPAHRIGSVVYGKKDTRETDRG